MPTQGSAPASPAGAAPWNRLFDEARAFASARQRAIQVAAASAAPTYAPAIGATSEALVLARRAADALAALRPEARAAAAAAAAPGAGEGVWDALFRAATTEAGLGEMARECDARLEALRAGGGGADTVGMDGALGSHASDQLAALVREMGGGGAGDGAGARKAAEKTAIWATLASERKDTTLLEAIKAQLELAACSFAPNKASLAEKVAAQQPGVRSLRSGTYNADTRPAAVWETIVADVSRQLSTA